MCCVLVVDNDMHATTKHQTLSKYNDEDKEKWLWDQ